MSRRCPYLVLQRLHRALAVEHIPRPHCAADRAGAPGRQAVLSPGRPRLPPMARSGTYPGAALQYPLALPSTLVHAGCSKLQHQPAQYTMHSPVPGARCQQAGAGAEAQRNDWPLVCRQHIQQAAGLEGPHKDLERVLAAGAHHLYVGGRR